jgi:hypothetical protein
VEPPSEWYLIEHRKLLFKDEWLFYTILLLLFFTDHWLMMIPVTILGAAFVLLSYRRQWGMEAMRFGGCIREDEPDPEVD